MLAGSPEYQWLSGLQDGDAVYRPPLMHRLRDPTFPDQLQSQSLWNLKSKCALHASVSICPLIPNVWILGILRRGLGFFFKGQWFETYLICWLSEFSMGYCVWGGAFIHLLNKEQSLPCVQWGSRHWGVIGSRIEMRSLQPDICMLQKETVRSNHGSRIVSDKDYRWKRKNKIKSKRMDDGE